MIIAALSLALALSTTQDRPVQSGIVQNTGNLAFGERLVVRRTADGIEAVEATRPGPDAAIPTQPQTANADGSNPLVTTAPGTVAFGLGGRRETGSILRVENATDQHIAYDAYIVRFVQGQRHGPSRTNVCTVPPGLAGFEMWPEPVVQVVIANVRTIEATAPSCEPAAVAE